jgi:tetratricopeptide (TPR) repeat protein
LERSGSGMAQRDFMRAGQAYLDANEAAKAESVYLQVVGLDPNHLEALQALVNIARSESDAEKQVKYGCELGDVLLARDKYTEAKSVFDQVIEADPENQKASARLQRLDAIVNGSPSTEAAPETEGQVTVKDEQTTPTQTDLDLAAILDEFRSSIVETIPSQDAQSHYDMGVAYVEMDLLKEAISEFETAAENEDIRPHALEMLAVCYRRASRGEDALVALEEVLALTNDDEGQARIHLAIGQTREEMGLDFEAEEAYFQALELNQDLVEAAERLSELEKKRA